MKLLAHLSVCKERTCSDCRFELRTVTSLIPNRFENLLPQAIHEAICCFSNVIRELLWQVLQGPFKQANTAKERLGCTFGFALNSAWRQLFISQPLPHYVVWYVQENSLLMPTAQYTYILFCKIQVAMQIFGALRHKFMELYLLHLPTMFIVRI